MGLGSHMGRDLLQMRGHGLEIAPGQDEPGSLALRRADGPEDVGPLGSLIVRRSGAGAASGPAAGDPVLLADAGLVLPPHFQADAGRQARFYLVQLRRGAFFNSSIA